MTRKRFVLPSPSPITSVLLLGGEPRNADGGNKERDVYWARRVVHGQVRPGGSVPPWSPKAPCIHAYAQACKFFDRVQQVHILVFIISNQRKKPRMEICRDDCLILMLMAIAIYKLAQSF
jgi:hypothetical protein